MKNWKCPNCFEEKITEDDIVVSLCMCGYYFKEVKEEKKDGRRL
jgi:hypothetical protein